MLRGSPNMLICRLSNCTCFHHRLLDCIEKGFNDEVKTILKNRENVCYLADSSGSSLLHYAAEYGNAALVGDFIEGGCKIDAQDDSGITPLMLAVQKKYVTTVEALLKHNANIFLADNRDGASSLHTAASLRLHSEDQNSHLIMEAMFDKINNDLLTDKTTTTRLLLNASDLAKFSIVVFADVPLASIMLKNGYEIDGCELLGRTALDCTILFAKLENAKMLIEHGASANTKNKLGYTPLHCYHHICEAVDEHSETLKYLLQCAVGDVTLSDRTKRPDIENLLLRGKKRTVRTVLQMGIDIHGRFSSGAYLLHLLIDNKNVAVMDLFDEFDIGFDVNARDLNGDDALVIAGFSGCLRKVEFLLKYGADVNSISCDGPSVMQYTVMNHYANTPEEGKDVAKIVELLLHRGADAQFNCGKSIVETMYNCKCEREPSTYVVLAHLAMLGALADSPLTDFTRSTIRNYASFENYFNLCAKQLEEMKSFEVYGRVTLFKLLTEPDEKVVAYARNQDLLEALESTLASMTHLESYYSNTLQSKMESFKNKIELERKAALAFESLTGLSSVAYYNIVYKILNFLNCQELQNLCKTESTTLAII